MPEHDPVTSPVLNRRTVVGGAAALGAGLVMAGCSVAPVSGGTSGVAAAGGAPAGTALGPATDVPVGSAKIFGEQGVVVTQASAGSFACFSAECPHQGCNVGSVAGEEIICPCHGSTFALDGSVVTGPARTGLGRRAVTVTGGMLTLA